MIVMNQPGSMTKQMSFDVNYDSKYRDRYPVDIDLNPNSDDHSALLTAILDRAQISKNAMSSRYDSWNTIDKTLSAYIDLTKNEESLKDSNSRAPISIVVPVSYATLNTLQAYMTAAFLNNPIFQYEGRSEEDAVGAALMERIIQAHCQRFQVGLSLMFLWRDAFAYNCGVAIPSWDIKRGYKKKATRMYRLSDPLLGGVFEAMEPFVSFDEVETILFEGNRLDTIDPYRLLPDPSVPLHDLQKGNYIGWVDRTNLISLVEDEFDDVDVFNVEYVKHINGKSLFFDDGLDDRDKYYTEPIQNDRLQVCDVIHMYVKLIPSECKLSTSNRPEKWLFSIVGDSVIIRARSAEMNHGMFPAVPCTPDADGYSLLAPSKLEMMSGLQDTVNFMYNSHFTNVRKAINDMFLIDPQIVEYRDVLNPIGRMMARIRPKFWGKAKLDQAMKQFPVNDVTRNHMQDVGNVMSIIERVTGATEGLQGMRRQTSERVSATEAQNTQMSALGRHELTARIISIMTMQPVAYQFAHNAQQFLEQGEYVKITGRGEEDLRQLFTGDQRKVFAGPSDINVDFDLVEHDGSVPGSGNPAQMMQAFQVMMSSGIGPAFDVVKLFLYIMKASGAKNVQDFAKPGALGIATQVMEDAQVADQVQAGNLVPIESIAGGNNVGTNTG